MDPLIYIHVPRLELIRLLACDDDGESLAVAGSPPERLGRLLLTQQEQVELTTADLKWVRDHITQVT